MPEYTYRCGRGHEFYVKHSMKESHDGEQCGWVFTEGNEEIVVCDDTLRRIITSAPGIVFKGDGWAGLRSPR